MKRILKMDLYRLFHSFWFYSIPAAEVIFLILAFAIGDNEGSAITIGAALSEAVSLINYVAMTGINIVMLAHWNAEHQSGFIKNYAGNINGRYKLAVSKMISAMIAWSVYYISTLLFVTIGDIMNGYTIKWEPLGDVKWTLLLWFLIGTASLAISLLLYEITHSSALGYVFAIFLCMGVIEELIVQVVYLINSDLKTWKYLLILGAQAPENSLAMNFIRTLLYGLVFFAGALVTAKKKDVKV